MLDLQPSPAQATELDARLRADGREVDRGEVGQVWIRKPGIDPDDAWVPIPDLLSWPEDAPVQFHGRLDDLMTLNGMSIFPGEIEDALLRHPGVREVVAYPRKSNRHGAIPVASVVAEDGVEEQDLMRFATEQLGQRGPRAVHIVAAIPRTVSGKAITRLLPDGG